MKRVNLKLEIKQLAYRMFLERGYTNVSVGDMSKILGISKGSVVHHFSTKENILIELIRDLCEFQWQVMEQEITIGRDSLIAYLYELATMAGSCYDNPMIRELCVSAYTHPLSLEVIRANDTKKTKKVFASYCMDWTEEDFVLAENIVSGIEYSLFVTQHEKEISLDDRLSKVFDAILKCYYIPGNIRKETIQKVLSMDYRTLGKRVLEKFREYVEEINRKELEEAALKKQM